MAKRIDAKSKESLSTGLRTTEPKPVTRGEGKRKIYESTLICHSLATACLFVAYVSPYWIMSWPRVHNTFKKMGLWEVCFSGMILPFDPLQKSYHGCWWILAPEYTAIRNWIMPGWFAFTQVTATICVVAQVINIIILFILWLRTGGRQKDGKYTNKDPLVLQQTCCFITSFTAFLLAATAVVFVSCFFTDREWLPNPYLNYPSWSFGLFIMSAFFSVFAAIGHVTYIMIIRHQLRRPPRAVTAPTGYFLAPRHDTSFATAGSRENL